MARCSEASVWGRVPLSMAFDGANIWVTNYESDSVTKLRASDGVAPGKFQRREGPRWRSV
jgi:hypothetical protein